MKNHWINQRERAESQILAKFWESLARITGNLEARQQLWRTALPDFMRVLKKTKTKDLYVLIDELKRQF